MMGGTEIVAEMFFNNTELFCQWIAPFNGLENCLLGITELKQYNNSVCNSV